MAPLDLPWAAVPGNHDARGAMREAFPEQLFPTDAEDLNSLMQIGTLDLVLLDSHVPGQPHGEVSDRTLRWLDRALAQDASRPALLFLHHPPFQTGIWHMDRQNLRNADALAAILVRHPRALMVAAGHVHRAVVTTFAGRPATICPAPNHAVDLDLGHEREPSFRLEPPGFHLHAWFAGGRHGSLVTHLVGIGDFAGPHPFFDASGKLL